MIKGIGIDIVELDRMENIIKRKPKMVHRLLTKKEQGLFHQLKNDRRKVEFLAGRFAAKEAFSKALGTGIGKLSFQDIEVLRNDVGAPTLHSQVLKQDSIFISISHSDAYAIAQVIIENESAY